MSTQLRRHNVKSGRELDLTKMFRCYALDAVSNFTYGESFDALLKPDFEETLLEAFDKFATASFFVSCKNARCGLCCTKWLLRVG